MLHINLEFPFLRGLPHRLDLVPLGIRLLHLAFSPNPVSPRSQRPALLDGLEEPGKVNDFAGLLLLGFLH